LAIQFGCLTVFDLNEGTGKLQRKSKNATENQIGNFTRGGSRERKKEERY
jgi:hypothetical protein